MAGSQHQDDERQVLLMIPAPAHQVVGMGGNQSVLLLGLVVSTEMWPFSVTWGSSSTTLLSNSRLWCSTQSSHLGIRFSEVKDLNDTYHCLIHQLMSRRETCLDGHRPWWCCQSVWFKCINKDPSSGGGNNVNNILILMNHSTLKHLWVSAFRIYQNKKNKRNTSTTSRCKRNRPWKK